ncbi:MAG: hypothetical protein AAFN92_18910 [Bacteroidota bacterium]
MADSKRTKLNDTTIYREMLWYHLGPFNRATGYAHRVSHNALWKSGRHLIQLAWRTLRYGQRGSIDVPFAALPSIWVVCSTKNHYDTLGFLVDLLPEAGWVATNKSAARLAGAPRLSWHTSLNQLFRFPNRFRSLIPDFGRELRDNWFLLFRVNGFYEAALEILKHGQPRMIIFSNDHEPEARSLLFAAKKRGIPTVYLQHASVTDFFPPLRFDLSLLEGQATLDVYRRVGPVTGRVEFIGMPKFDGFVDRTNRNDVIQKVGVCISFLDEEDRVVYLLEQLARHFPDMSISFRAHPRDNRSFAVPATVSISINSTLPVTGPTRR